MDDAPSQGGPGGHPTARRRLSRVAVVAVGVLVALAGAIGLVLFFNGRDDATFSSEAGPGVAYPDLGHAHLKPGQRPDRPYNSDPPTSGPHVPVPVTRDGATLSDDQILHALEAGDVILFYGSARPPAGARALAREEADAFEPAVAEAGQAVILARRPGTKGVVAAAWRHLQPVSSASDPKLRAFVDYWLARGAR